MQVRTDCRHFPGDRPCTYHKRTGIDCSQCDRYSPRGERILIVKFDALGDVLRTTCVLPSLKRKYPRSYITWITSPDTRALFEGNRMVDEVMTSSSIYIPAVLSRRFDVVINPDTSIRSSQIATIANAESYYGYAVNPSAEVVPLNAAAEAWLEMGASDKAKRANRKTYQRIIHEICELDPAGQRIVLGLTDRETAAQGDLAAEIGIQPGRPVVGMNTGAGLRWKNKRWRSDRWVELVSMLRRETDAQVVLLGGVAEAETNAGIASDFETDVFDPGPRGLREFICIVGLCDVVVTGDTMALHVAAGLGKRVVALFGPTSAAEIDLYGRGTKIVTALDCACCYRRRCDVRPGCMDVIEAPEVFAAVMENLERKRGKSPEEYEMVGEPGR